MNETLIDVGIVISQGLILQEQCYNSMQKCMCMGDMHVSSLSAWSFAPHVTEGFR